LEASSTGSSFGCLAVIDLAVTVAVVFLVAESAGFTTLVALLAELVDALFVAGFAAALDVMSGIKRDSADNVVTAVHVNRLWRLAIWLAPSLAILHFHHFFALLFAQI
jgi:hypothetical protein